MIRSFGEKIFIGLKFIWSRHFMPIWKPLASNIWKIVGILLICCLFKYLFLTNCLSIQSIKMCVTSGFNDNSTLFTIASLLFAFVVIIPTFWIESKIKDAGKEASQDILKEVREDMQLLSKAQMLIFEAENYQSPASLMAKNQLIINAVTLWPSFRQIEYRKLGDDFSRVIINSFYPTQNRMTTILGADIQKDQIYWYVNHAISYLEETVLNTEALDREGLVNLACMYSCATRYENMIRVIEKVVRIDDNAKDDFQEAKRLSLLIFACGSSKSHIERLGNKIGLTLPLPKTEFTHKINDIDFTGRSTYIRCFAIKKISLPTENPICMLQFFANDTGTGRLVNSGGYYRTLNSSTYYHDSLVPNGKEISVDDFAEKVYQDFFVICFQDE